MSDDVKMEKVAYDTDFFSRVKDIFQSRKKREIDLDDSNDGEKVSVFSYIKSSPSSCSAGSQKENEIIKKRRRRNIMSSQRQRFSSDFLRDKRRAEQEVLQLQHQYMRCNKDVGPDSKVCMGIYTKFQKLVKEINEKFHQFNDDNFEYLNEIEMNKKRIERKEQENDIQTNEVEPFTKVDQLPFIQKNKENVGQTFFGDGFYSYTYDQIPKFHEDLHDGQQRTSAREEPIDNQGRPGTIIHKDQSKNIPINVPEPTGKIIKNFIRININSQRITKVQADHSYRYAIRYHVNTHQTMFQFNRLVSLISMVLNSKPFTMYRVEDNCHLPVNMLNLQQLFCRMQVNISCVVTPDCGICFFLMKSVRA